MASKTIGDLLELLRCEIKDPDGDIWDDKTLIDKINQAYSHLLMLRPDCFSQTMEITLERGKCLHSVCDCSELISVISIGGNDCCTLDEESSSDNVNFLSALYDECPSDDGESFKPTSYTKLDCGQCAGFRINQPTPTDRDITAIICCTTSLDICPKDENINDLELPNKLMGRLYEGFFHLILSKVYAVDRKCKDLLELSQWQFKMWQDFRDWWMRVDFAKRQANWDIYREKTTDRQD